MLNLVRGNFASYAIESGLGFADDEEAIDIAFNEMFTMCGNAGQETLIGDQLDNFYEWALQALEEVDAYAVEWGDFATMVYEEWYDGRIDKWEGTEEIWVVGWMYIAEQSGHHDTADEYGEGTGQKFG